MLPTFRGQCFALTRQDLGQANIMRFIWGARAEAINHSDPCRIGTRAQNRTRCYRGATDQTDMAPYLLTAPHSPPSPRPSDAKLAPCPSSCRATLTEAAWPGARSYRRPTEVSSSVCSSYRPTVGPSTYLGPEALIRCDLGHVRFFGKADGPPSEP